jgi:L-lactate dehydrogenase complex protein LldG
VIAATARASAFAARAEAVGAIVWQVGETDVPALVERLLVDAAARQVALDSGVRDAFPRLAEQLTGAGLSLLPPDAEPRTLAQADAGVSLGAFAIAETGSIAVAPSSLADRLVSMLPPLHVLLVPISVLLDNLDAAAGQLRAWTTGPAPARYVSFVTGPSRTADIERVLTIGVQGPRVLHDVLFDSAAPAT